MADEPKKDDQVNPLQAVLDKEIHDKKAAKERATAAEKENADLKKRLDAIEAETKKAAEEAERAKHEGAGEYDKALAAQAKSFEEKLAAKDTAIANLQGSITNLVGKEALAVELGKAGVKSHLIDQAVTLLKGRVKVEFVDGAPKVTALDSTGQPLFIEGKTGGVSDIVAGWTPDNPHFLPPTGDNGSGQHTGTGTGSITIDDLDNDKTGNATKEFIQKHGQAEYQKLADKKQK